jgi:hypothetical protein
VAVALSIFDAPQAAMLEAQLAADSVAPDGGAGRAEG